MTFADFWHLFPALGQVGRDLDFPPVGSVRPLRLPGSLDCLREIGRQVGPSVEGPKIGGKR